MHCYSKFCINCVFKLTLHKVIKRKYVYFIFISERAEAKTLTGRWVATNQLGVPRWLSVASHFKCKSNVTPALTFVIDGQIGVRIPIIAFRRTSFLTTPEWWRIYYLWHTSPGLTYGRVPFPYPCGIVRVQSAKLASKRTSFSWRVERHRQIIVCVCVCVIQW